MDLLTHALLTWKLVDGDPSVVLAGVGPDIPWYLTYPVWLLAKGQAVQALKTGEWPEPPAWIETLHHASHSFPVACGGALMAYILIGRWPRRHFEAWMLHIAVDIPTHSRRFWGPRFLWPIADVAVDGVPLAEITSRWVAAVWRNITIAFPGAQVSLRAKPYEQGR